MTAWPGVSWQQIEREWTDSQLVMLLHRLEERLEEEQAYMERIKRGQKPMARKGPRRPRPEDSKAAMMSLGARAHSYPNLKSAKEN